jgi:hypothetical protein
VVTPGQERVRDRPEDPRLSRAERTAADHVQGPGELGVGPVDLPWVVVRPPGRDLGRGEAEDDDAEGVGLMTTT